MKVNYKNIVDKETFIGEFLEYMSTQETPYAYDFWCAVWLISLALGRQIKIDRPRAPVYFNWYILLIAESGVTRKSTAVRSATKIARDFLLNNKYARLIENKTTSEHLERTLHECSVKYNKAELAISVSELIRLLGKEKYKMGLPGLLTDLYDCPEYQIGGGTVSHGEIIFKNVFINLISASTPSWLLRNINKDVIEGGFTSRVIWVVEEKRKRKEAWPEHHNHKKVETFNFVEQLNKIEEMAQRINNIELNEGAMKAFTDWYNYRKESHDSFCASFESREDSHILKLAGILAINANRWKIHQIDIVNAIKIIKEIKNKGADIFVGFEDKDKVIIGINRIRERLLITGKNSISQTELFLYCRNYLNKVDFNLILSIMHELQLVQKFENKRATGRPVTLWRGTNLLTSTRAVDTVIEEYVNLT